MAQPLYRVMLLGYPARTIDEVWSSTTMVYYGLLEGFSRLGGVEVVDVDALANHQQDMPLWLSSLPMVDVIVMYTYNSDVVHSYRTLLSSKARLGIIGFYDGMRYDWNVTSWRRPHTNVLLPFMCLKQWLRATTKTKRAKSILLDHSWPPHWGADTEWTQRIWDWLELVRDEYYIAQIQYSNLPRDPVCGYPDWVKLIPSGNFLHYLQTTASFETFVMTHAECGGNCVQDMAGRGIRVLVPRYQKMRTECDGHDPWYAASAMSVYRLDLPTFSDGKELLECLEAPYDEDVWASKVDLCTDIAYACGVLDARIRMWKKERKHV